MDKLRAIKLFVRLAELGSFTKVAEEVHASKSMISKEVSRLENEVGARLLQRSTRNLQLTEAGKGYLIHSREILLKLDDADAFIQDLQNKPRGKLKINAPMALGLTDLALMFSEFMLKYPDIELDISLDDRPIDLIEQGFDMGIRAASRPFDSSYIGKALFQFNFQICASPKYLKANPEIIVPEDLDNHNCFVYTHFRGKNVWPLEQGIAVKGNLRVNNTIFMLEAIKKGLGIGFIPAFICKKALLSGEVVEILKDIARPKLTLYVLYPARQFVPPKLVRCVDFIESWFNAEENGIYDS